MDASRESVNGQCNGPILIAGCGKHRCERSTAAVPPGRVVRWVLAVGLGLGFLEASPCGVVCGQEQRVSRPRTRSLQLEPLFAAIAQVESRGRTDKAGDGGRSLGTYQIQAAYWRDGGGDPSLYRRLVTNDAACRRVMIGYWRRFCPAALAAGDFETLARVHNGGADGAAKAGTAAYWQKVRHAMESSPKAGK
jgi:hypothetical protein